MDATPRDRKSIADVFQQVWAQAVVRVTGAEEEVQKLLGRLQGMAGSSQDEVKKQVRELTERLAHQRSELEKRVEETVHASLSRVRVPRRDEVEKLNARLDTLSKRVEALSR
jgi:polyhydroxyalkanoate synthesis regulator phasin